MYVNEIFYVTLVKTFDKLAGSLEGKLYDFISRKEGDGIYSTGRTKNCDSIQKVVQH